MHGKQKQRWWVKSCGCSANSEEVNELLPAMMLGLINFSFTLFGYKITFNSFKKTNIIIIKIRMELSKIAKKIDICSLYKSIIINTENFGQVMILVEEFWEFFVMFLKNSHFVKNPYTKVFMAGISWPWSMTTHHAVAIHFQISINLPFIGDYLRINACAYNSLKNLDFYGPQSRISSTQTL